MISLTVGFQLYFLTSLVLSDPLLGLLDSLLRSRVVPWQRDALSTCLSRFGEMGELLPNLFDRQGATNTTAVAIPPIWVLKRRIGIGVMTLKAMTFGPDLSAVIFHLVLL
jgi:hypothetical protein